ncbi:MAG: VWA domain-containing protein [Schleiferiaceae bacterium]|jgi:Mg-chelatase subunit ChlD|nr:VWA domain-containing protein [Schleiferiaceae bacterium]
MKKFKGLAALGLILLFAACKKTVVNPPPPDLSEYFELHVDYHNVDGQSPKLAFDENASSPEVKIDFKSLFTGNALPPNLINININSVRIIDDNNTNYEIKEILAYEWREDINDWKNDVEFIMKYEQTENLNVMMVLDASASLGDDFSKVKSYAKDFAQRVYNETPNAQIGVIQFSDVIGKLPLTSNANDVYSYIDNMQQGNFTTLYEAMNMGITDLENSLSESKTILTFTDGTDNNSGPVYTPTYLKNKLTNESVQPQINSFTIGLEGNGGVDKIVLQELAANGGAAEFPKNINQLESVFNKFSSTISNVYNLTYLRNQQVVNPNEPLQLKFVIKAVPK